MIGNVADFFTGLVKLIQQGITSLTNLFAGLFA